MLLIMNLCIFFTLLSLCSYIFDLSDACKQLSIPLIGGCVFCMAVALLGYYGVLGVENMESMRSVTNSQKVLGLCLMIVNLLIVFGIVYGLISCILRDKKCKKD